MLLVDSLKVNIAEKMYVLGKDRPLTIVIKAEKDEIVEGTISWKVGIIKLSNAYCIRHSICPNNIYGIMPKLISTVYAQIASVRRKQSAASNLSDHVWWRLRQPAAIYYAHIKQNVREVCVLVYSANRPQNLCLICALVDWWIANLLPNLSDCYRKSDCRLISGCMQGST